jgi:hypothetical protein
MDNKLQKHAYLTQEAAYVFTTLASKAGERIGLMIRLTQTFSRGYGWVRTGWFNPSDIEKEYVIKQLFFFKIFFPLGGYFNWYFDSPEVKTKLKAILHKFVGWQDDPRSYIEDVKRFKDQLEPLWKGLSWTLDISTADRSERCKIRFLLNCALGSKEI